MQKPKINATVVFLVDQEGRICLARKKQPIHTKEGSIEYSLGRYNGYGGKAEWWKDFWSLRLTAVRELLGESGVFALMSSLTPVYRAYFANEKDGTVTPFMSVTFYSCRKWIGQPRESGEMGAPEWFAPSSLPFSEMMPADQSLITRMFDGVYFEAEVILGGKNVPPKIRIL